ncbi:MAG TPA: hypothetical protein PKD45_11655 [Flavobacteriales bacterium]|nr:hypothetical protein [Flavobacteriales bacterium]
MNKYAVMLAVLMAATGCKAPQFILGAEQEGVSVSYRWNHRPEKPSELLLKITNNAPSARQVHVEIDLSHQALTVEQFTADTCIPAGRTFNGKLNGIYFVPQHLTPAQAASSDTKVELTRLETAGVESCR